MIGMVLIAHEQIASEMLCALEHVVGPQALVETLSIAADADIDACKERLMQLIGRCDAGEGVLLLADMFGGTPCNLALSCLASNRVEVLSGLNLPMLVKAATLRSSLNDVCQLAIQAQEAGRHHIHRASELLNGKEKHA